MGEQEPSGDSGAMMRAMVQVRGTGRLGQPDDINDAAFLLVRETSLITGTDMLVDGGVTAALKSGAFSVQGE